ncbi:MAG: GspE/PulE family protein [bacterium]|nr:GspE/PulE family protein [bacterium]
MPTFDDEKQEKELSEIKLQEEEDLIRLLAQKNGLPYIDLVPVPIETDALRLLPESEAREVKIASFAVNGKKVGVAVFSPNKEGVTAAIEKITKAGFTPTLYMASTRSLEKAWSRYKELSEMTVTHEGEVGLESGIIADTAAKVQTLPELVPLLGGILNDKDPNRVSRFVELILGSAIALDASDIHIEPEASSVRLRFRLDGILQEVLSFERAIYALVNSRVKLLAGLKLNVKSEAQDGRFSVNLKDTDIEIRVSLLPGAYGESIVLRVLNPKTIAVPFEDLGLHPRLLEVVEQQIAKPNGMLLTTGPTGSGKTTTLYAFLRKIYSPGVKVITIEDPIEYHLAGIVQTQTDKDKGYTFAQGLRSALRQDPDVLMVGEIRDEETAEVAINASLTGHLVFSTLHTNNAAGSFPRLIDLGVNPKVISSAVNLSLAQRLVRKLCAACKEETTPTEKEKAQIDTVLRDMPNTFAPKEIGKIWKPKGCEKCNNTGYKGRTGVYEAIQADAAIEKIIRENPSEREIAAAARPQEIPTMQEDGVLKVLSGITSLEELERVVDLTK